MRVLMVRIPLKEAIVTVDVDSESERGRILQETITGEDYMRREEVKEGKVLTRRQSRGRAIGRNVRAVALPPPNGEDS